MIKTLEMIKKVYAKQLGQLLTFLKTVKILIRKRF